MTTELLDRKQHLLRQEMGRYPDAIMSLADHGFLNEKGWRAVKEQDNGARKAAAFMDLLMKDFNDDEYQALADALMSTENLNYLGDELDLEAAVELKKVKPTPRMDDDAKMVVHRYLGQSRRHTENEKKKIQSIIAKRLCVLYQANERHLQRLNEAAELEREKGEELEDTILKMMRALHEYNESQEEERIAYNIDAGDSQQARGRSDILATFDLHATETRQVIDLTNAVCLEVDKQQNLLNILKARLDESHREKPLDEGLQAQLEEILNACNAEKKRLEEEEARVQKLTEEMEELKLQRRKELSTVRKKGQQSRGWNDNTLGLMIALSNEQGWLRDELLNIFKDIDIWKWRLECLERGQDINALYREKNRYRPVYISHDDISLRSSPAVSVSSIRNSPYPLQHSSSTNSLPSVQGLDTPRDLTPLQKMVTRLRIFRYTQTINSPRPSKKMFQYP